MDIQKPDALLIFFIIFRLFSLPLEAVHLAFYFDNNIFKACKVPIGCVDLLKCFFLADLKSCDPGSFFNKNASLFRAGIGDGTNISLLDNGVGFGAHAASKKYIVDILKTTGLLVKKIGAFTGSVKTPG